MRRLITPAILRASFVFLACLAANIGFAQDQYCAQRTEVQPATQCFNTLAQAEAFIRVEPEPEQGYRFLEASSMRQGSLGKFTVKYTVGYKPYKMMLASLYKVSTVGGWGSHSYDCGFANIVPGVPYRGCFSEEAASDGMLQRYPFEGSDAMGSFRGAYMPDPPEFWNGSTTNDGIGLISIVRNVLPEDADRDWIITYPNSSNEYVHGVSRTDVYQCPWLFGGSSHPRGYPIESPWPMVCRNSSYGSISKQSAQYDSCGTKDGNPCVAATGNKEYRQEDFRWEGQPFARAYNSIRDLPLRSGFDDSWAHTYSERVIMRSNVTTDMYWIRGDGYFEAFSKIDESTYQSRNATGVVLYREPDATAATHGRWRVVIGNGDIRWFTDSGRLNRLESGARSFTFFYCEDAPFSAGECNAPGSLIQVRSSAGRTLNFQYTIYQISIGPSEHESLNQARITSITADGIHLLSYGYDTLGRLTEKSTISGIDHRYLYAEPDKLCRMSAGDVISGCDSSRYPYHLTGVIDANLSRHATYTYDEWGRVTSSAHAGDVGKVKLSYQSSNTVEVEMPTGSRKTYTFSSAPFRKPTQLQQTSTDGSAIRTSSFTYESMRLTSRIDQNGAKSTFVYNDFHESSRTEGLTSSGAVTPQTRTIQTDWHPTLSFPTESRTYNDANVLISKSAWTYNTRGQPLTAAQTDPATSVTHITTTTYCEQADLTAGTCPLLGLVQSVDGPRTDASDVTAYAYRTADEATCAISPATCPYRKGDLWKVTNALNQVAEILRHDGAGRVLSVKDPNGVITDFEYHPRGWLTARKVRGTNNSTETDDQITRIEYWPTGLVKQVTQPDGSFTAYAYDAAHRLTDIFDGDGNRIHYTLDNAGNRTQEDTTDEQGVLLRTLSRVYNQLGQLQTQKDANQQPTGFTYDANGNTDTVTDALSRVTDHDYDPLNRLQRTLQDVGGIEAETTFKYDAQDNLTKVIDPKGLDTDYTYNAFGDLLTLSSPDTGTTTYTYDSAGNRKTQTDARNKTATYAYDALNRLTGVSYSLTSPLNITYTYDAVQGGCTSGETFSKGRLTRMQDSTGSTDYCHDRFGNLTAKFQLTNGRKFDTRYAYTLGGQLRSITYPDGAVVDYVRNAQGQVTEVGAKPAAGTRQVLLREATYYPFGPVAEWVYGNGRLMRRSLNQNYQPGFVEDPSAGGISIGYEFDVVGNLGKLRSANQTNPPQRLFGYDDLNRLTEVKHGTTQALLQGYDYDKTGNRLSATAGGTTAYTYPTTSHRLSAVGGTERSYDNAGNTTAIGGTARQFVYSDAGRLAQVKQASVAKMNYAYNGRGEQVVRYLGSAYTYTVYDEAGRWLGDYDTNGVAKQQAIWLDDLPVGLLVGSSASQKLHYVQPDALGTPRVVIDVQRDKAVWNWPLTGEAFGTTPPNQDPDGDATQFVFDMRFAGQRYDAASGLNYNYWRDGYENQTGRYTQSDPIGLAGGLNTYRYAYADPLKYMDPSGLSSCTTVFCTPSFSQERLLSSTLTNTSPWRLENVHVEPIAAPPVPPTRLAGLLPLPIHMGKQVAQCFYDRIKTYTDLYESYSQQLCLEACAGGECDNSPGLRWKRYEQTTATFEKTRREREIHTIGIMHAVPLLRCMELLGGLK